MLSEFKKIKFYVDTPFWYFRKKNTDWQYTLSLKDMTLYAPLEAIYSSEKKLVFEVNWSWLKGKIKQVLQIRSLGISFSRLLRNSVLVKSNVDVIYSHGQLPLVKLDIPVVWFYGVVDPDMRLATGYPKEEIIEEYKNLKPYFEKATVVLFATKSMMQRHGSQFPNLISKFAYAPFFLGHIKIATKEVCLNKHVDDFVIKLLFVGREAKRKGLDILLDAIPLLPKALQNRLHIDIVTSGDEFKKRLTESISATWHSEVSKKEVQNLMEQAHIFVMPSRFESYGFVYIEAMAAGAVVIAPSWESQIEICDYGKAGVLINAVATDVASAICRLENRDVRIDLSEKALLRCENEYSPAAVAFAHHKIFRQALVKQC